MEKWVPAGTLSKFLSNLPLPTLHLNVMPLSIKEKQAKQPPWKSPAPFDISDCMDFTSLWKMLQCTSLLTFILFELDVLYVMC